MKIESRGGQAASTEQTVRLPRTRVVARPDPTARTLRRVGLLGIGAYAPERVLSNEELERLVDTSDDWIVTRTGMRERRIAAPGETASDLATRAARIALSRAELQPENLELILVATVTPEMACPCVANVVQERLAAHRAVGFDIAAACSGFVNALSTAHHLLAARAYDNALVIGVETLSTVVDYSDRESCVLFGDGAGAVVLTPDPEGREMLDHLLGMDGSGGQLITVPSACSMKDPEGARHIGLQGRRVFKFAVNKMVEVVEELLQRNGLTVDDLDFLIPHQANLRILEAAAEKLRMPMDKVLVNIQRFGNTSSASVPLALDQAVREGRLKEGQLVCTVAFGGGLTWGASLLRW